MAAYATFAELAPAYLPQVNPGDQETEALLTAVIARAQGIVDGVLRFTFDGYTSATDVKVRANGGTYFRLPAHDIGTVTAVVDGNGTAVDTDYWIEDVNSGSLIAMYNGTTGRWFEGFYDVTADWGYGVVPPEIVEIVLELSVHIWQSRSAGNFSNVIGVQGGGAVGYERALTPRQLMTLQNVIRQHRQTVV